MVELKTSSADETVEAGAKLGSFLQKGDIVCLSGELGTGKTAFASGIARALGVKGHVTSPTFTIVNEYAGRVPLYHFDAYRIADAGEMFDVGFEEYLEGSGVVVIEWADLIKDILPDDLIWVDIRKDMSLGADVRIIGMEFRGERYIEYEKNWKG